MERSMSTATRKRRGISIVLSIGRWGGFYACRGACWRLCLGWLAFTVYPYDDLDLSVWQKAAEKVLREVAEKTLKARAS
jgi:hypothetical protein